MKKVAVSSEFLTKVVTHIEKTSGVFDGLNKQAVEVDAQAKVTLDTLKKQGLAQAGVADEVLLQKLANPVEALRALERTARLVGPPSMGRSDATEKAASEMNAEDKFAAALGV